MTEDLPDAPWAKEELPDAPWAPSIWKATPEAPDHGLSERQKLSPVGKALSPVTGYWDTYKRMNEEAREQMVHGAEQITHPDSLIEPEAHGISDVLSGAGNVAAGGLGYAFSPATAAYRSVVGQPIEDVTGIPREYPEFAAELATPGIGLTRVGTPKILVKPAEGPLGVTLSQGQETGELPAIRSEQSAIRGQLGSQAGERAKAFGEQQAEQLEGATSNVNRSLDVVGNQELAKSPLEAAGMAGEAVKREAARAKGNVESAYQTARGKPGEIDAGVFQGIGNRIKNVLSSGDEPSIIDDKTTPFASKALQDIEENISRLRIQNRAELNTPNPEDIVGVNLNGVDQTRKRLVQFRRDAYSSGNAADGRAASGVVKAFDDLVDHAVNNGSFTGDPSAVRAWNAARAAHADYMATFGKNAKDPVGRVMEKVLGGRGIEAASPEAIADHLYGASGTNPSDLNVAVARRFKNILGEQSPEWAAVKQGLFKKLTDTGEGVASYGPGQIAQRLNKFLNVDGGSLSNVVFSPQDKQLLQQYADLHRKLQIPRTGANFSETSTFTYPILKNILTGVGSLVGAVIGHAVMPGMMGSEIAGAAVGASSRFAVDAAKANKIAKQMPLVAENLKRYERAMDAATKGNTPLKTGLAVASQNLITSLHNIGYNGVTLKQLQHVDTDQNKPASAGFARGGNVNHANNSGKVHSSGSHKAKGGATVGNVQGEIAEPDEYRDIDRLPQTGTDVYNTLGDQYDKQVEGWKTKGYLPQDKSGPLRKNLPPSGPLKPEPDTWNGDLYTAQRKSGGRVAAEKALPRNHQLGMRVPRGGSNCAKCKFFKSPDECGNTGFVKWNGSAKLPAPANQYCCDLYAKAKGFASGGALKTAYAIKREERAS